VPTRLRISSAKEWNIRDAYIKGPDGEKIFDFNESNLHVVIGATWADISKANRAWASDIETGVPQKVNS
jgi:phosphotransferase system IIB component